MKQLFVNGTILTMERELYAQAVLTEDGKILSVGNLDDLIAQAGPDVQKVDLGGCTLLPAFVDAHSHFSAVATGMLQLSVETCSSFRELEEAIRAFISQRGIAKDEWILAKGYDQNRLQEGGHPPLSLLDRAAPSNP